MPDDFDFQPEAESNEFDFQPESPTPSEALDFATKAPVSAVSGLTRILQQGAEGADMGRRQLAKEDLANQMAKVRLQRDWGNAAQSVLGGAERGVGFVKEMEPLNLLKRTLEIPAQLSGTPYKIQPLVSPEQVRNFLVPTPEQAGSVSSGIQQAGSEFLSGFTSPDQIAALAAGGSAPELVARLFQIKTASDVPPQLQGLWEAVKTGDKSDITKAAVSLAATAAIPAAIERGARKASGGPKIQETPSGTPISEARPLREPISPESPLPKAPKLQGEEREFQILRENWLPTIKGWRREMLDEEVAKGQGTHNIETNMEDSPGAQDVTRAKRYYELARKLYGRVEGEEIPPATPTPKLPPEPISEQVPPAATTGGGVESPIRENGGRTSLILKDGTAIVGGRIHAQTYDAALTQGLATESQLSDSVAGFTKPDGTSWDLQGKPIAVKKVVNLSEAPPSVRAGEAQPSAAPGGVTVETPVSAGETPQAKGEVAMSPPEPQLGSVTQSVTEPTPLRSQIIDHWRSKVEPVLHDFFKAFNDFGAERLERNNIKPPGMSASEWLEKVLSQQPTWQKGRKTGLTAIQMLSGKDLWPTEGPEGEALRKSMLAAVKALKNAPGRNSKWILAQELSDTQRTGTPEIVGMGGAVPSEFEVPQGTPTSTKNAVVDQERVKRGLPEALQPARREFGEVWDRAMAKIDQDPELPHNLIQELDRRPRAATDEENAILLRQQVVLQNEYARATRDLAQAFEDGRDAAVDAEKVRVSNLLDNLKQVYDVGKKVGTETGRGLNARKMLANEDFTLGKMTMDMMAAKGGAKLTPDQALEIQKLHDKIKATQDAYDDYVSRSNVKIADLERQLGEQPRFTPPIIKAAERIVSTLDTRANAARQRLKEKMTRFSAGVDPTIIADLAEIGASHIAHLGLDFAKWSSEMVKELGEWVRPHLDEAYAASQKAIDSIQGVPAVVKEGVKTAFSRLTPEEKVAATVDAIKQRVADKKPDEITFFVQRLARDLVARGVRDRDKLIDQVHEVIKQAIPEFTKRQTMDAISGYGDFKQLSKDEISVALRGMKGEMQQIAKLEDMQKGQPPLKSGTERRTPTEIERQLIKLVNEAKFKFQVPVQDPTTQLKSALDTLKTTLKNRIADYEDRIARGDYSARPKRELVLDPEASRLKAQNERVKKEFQKGVELERFKNAQPFERGAHWINKWRRGFILSSPITLAKLTAAAAQRMAFTPIEEGVGAAYSKAFPGLAARAPREGGFSPSAETLAITRGITEGMRDAWDLIKTGESDLDAMYGKTSALPGSFLDFFGRVHGALKSSTKRAEFTRSMQKRIEFGRRNGVDVTDPWVQMKMGVEAYKDANRSIFMQDNRVVSAYRRFIGALEQKSKVTGQVPASGKAAATAARVLLPIVKVPTNIVAETLDYALGSVTGGTRLARAYAKGIDQLKPEEADLVLRQLKKGSLGLAVMTLGFLNPNVVGGYYQRGEKRKPGDAKVGSIQVYGHNVPSFLLHNPLLETAQIGATARRVADAHRSRSTEKKGLGEGLYAAAVGLGEEVPFVREMSETTKAFDPTQKNAFWGELGKSLVIPQAVQWIATHTDKDAKGNPIKRSPKTTLEHIETGIPGLREKVPKKKGQ